MTFTIHFGPGWYTLVAFLAGLVCIASSESHGYAFGPTPRELIGLALWVSIPFVWLGWFLR